MGKGHSKASKKKIVMTPKPQPVFPSRDDILKFVQENPTKSSKREIARAFNIFGPARIELKKMIKRLVQDGLIERQKRKNLTTPGNLPNITAVEVTHVDRDGELFGQLLQFDDSASSPKIMITASRRILSALSTGDKVLARLNKITNSFYEAKVIRLLREKPSEIVGVFNIVRGQGCITPADRKNRRKYLVDSHDSLDSRAGEVVLAEELTDARLGLRRARVKKRLGLLNDPRSYSIMAIYNQKIPVEFSDSALSEAAATDHISLGQRTDLRHLPLITIDPSDASDHDDAILATPDDNPANKNGWKVVVAIADVAAYVDPGSALDYEAQTRGNSVYFPDLVVPMLPDRLSTNLCSLRADEDRASVAVTMWFDQNGKKIRHKFSRALVRIRRNLSYQDVQDNFEGVTKPEEPNWVNSVISNLYGAYQCLKIARQARQPLNIEVPENKILLNNNGQVEALYPLVRVESHRLVEEFMVAANVAAAEELEEHSIPCMYRIHERPSEEKINALHDVLSTLELSIGRGTALKSEHFNQILRSVHEKPQSHVVNQIILRTQNQALYSPKNIGHFGLNLTRYAHFTSPIRRYADLLVHRALISSLEMRNGLKISDSVESFNVIGEKISATERRAMMAERESIDRYRAAYLSERLGDEFNGRISGVSRFGLFITLDNIGADGLVPTRALGGEYFHHDRQRHTLIGAKSRYEYHLGTSVTVRLIEANTTTGSIRLELLRHEENDYHTKEGSNRTKRPTSKIKKKPQLNKRMLG